MGVEKPGANPADQPPAFSSSPNVRRTLLILKSAWGFMPPLSVPEIEAKIQQQTEAAEKSILEIIELLELLCPFRPSP